MNERQPARLHTMPERAARIIRAVNERGLALIAFGENMVAVGGSWDKLDGPIRDLVNTYSCAIEQRLLSTQAEPTITSGGCQPSREPAVDRVSGMQGGLLSPHAQAGRVQPGLLCGSRTQR
jgi:hypothetical protein